MLAVPCGFLGIPLDAFVQSFVDQFMDPVVPDVLGPGEADRCIGLGSEIGVVIPR